MTTKKFIATGILVGMLAAGWSFYLGYAYGHEQGTEMWEEWKMQQDMKENGTASISEVRAILGVGICPNCGYDNYEIDYSIVSQEEHGYCPECHYFQTREIGTKNIQVYHEGKK